MSENEYYLKWLLFLILIHKVSPLESNELVFPENLLFGVSTSAYQIEGAWDADGKGENIWDHLTHNHPQFIEDGSNGDVASDSYDKINEDVALLKELGINIYHFSLSWSRLLPKGFATEVNQKAVDYYNHLIDRLLAEGIEPIVTLYHWDLPQVLQKLGGWVNEIMVDYYLDFAKVAFDKFGNKVKYWISFNRPEIFCAAYGASNDAPVEVNADGYGDYLCGHTVLLAHAKAYRLYNESYKEKQQGSFGLSVGGEWFESNSTSSEDVLAAYRMLQFTTGWFVNPILKGDYPNVMKETVAKVSQEQGLPYSRLPQFTEEEKEFVKGTADFLALNFNATQMISDKSVNNSNSDPACELDVHVNKWIDSSWKSTTITWMRAVSWGLRNILLWIRDEYNNPAIFIIQNGYPEISRRSDSNRINFLMYQLSALLEAISNGVNIKSYSIWNFIDGFEWSKGYTTQYGLYFVDMEDPKRRRYPKTSAEFYKKVISNKRKIARRFFDFSKASRWLNGYFTILLTLFVVLIFN